MTHPRPSRQAMGHRLIGALLLGAGSLLALSPSLLIAASSEAAPPKDAAAAQLKKRLLERFPQMPILSLQPTDYGTLWEVFTGNELLYVDSQATFMLQGDLLDLKSLQNITDQRLKKLQQVRFEDFPLDLAVSVTRGNGRQKLVIFADPNCGYCKRLEQTLQGINDITVYTFLFPILSPDSVEKSKRIACSADPGRAWLGWTLDGRLPESPKSCAFSPDKILALGRRLGVAATPTIFFQDGSRAAGALTKPDLLKKLGRES